jgi:hypothetical protein
LGRFFAVKEDERAVWAEIDELRSRLEALGHAVATNMQPATPVVGAAGALGGRPTEGSARRDLDRRDLARREGADPLAGPLVAIVVPATSKGVPLSHGGESGEGGGGDLDASLRAMPLFSTLVKSLYATCEPAFEYLVVVATNVGDPILGDASKVETLPQHDTRARIPNLSEHCAGFSPALALESVH